MYKIILALLISTAAQAQDTKSNWRLLEADSVTMETSKVYGYRNPYMPDYDTGSGGEEWRYGTAAEIDLTLVGFKSWNMFWRNRVHSHGTTNQVRHVGWYWELGFDVWPDKVELFHRHHSQHCMECDGPANDVGFPLLDEFALKFKLYERD
jgi:hypothetical protein